ncbi:hypothetical protein DEO72_LG11g1499 [Vigna unguiculata]|nr:hypothetical protein DEO72_LG11g1499 [Vigna unguiculata]
MARKPPLLNLQKNERPSLGRNPFWKESSMAKLQDLEARAALEILEIQGMTPGYPRSAAKPHQHHLRQQHLLTCTAYTIIAKHKKIG